MDLSWWYWRKDLLPIFSFWTRSSNVIKVLFWIKCWNCAMLVSNMWSTVFFFFFLQWLSTKWGLFHNGVYLHGAIGDLVTLWAFHQPVTAIILHYWHLADNLIQNDLHNCLQSRCYGNAFETVMAFNGRVDKWEVRDVYVFAWWLFNCYPCVTLLHRVDTIGDNL